jgi:anaerobic magnesium-protoporphyrin IX monomethyl ester cyclase
MLAKMKQAGIYCVACGFESGSKKVLDVVTKGYKQEAMQKAVKMTYDTGLYIIGNFIFGLPDDDYESMRETLDLAKELNCELANLYCAMAYPGSQLYELPLKNGWLLPKNWSGYSQYSVDTTSLPTNYLSPTEVLRFRDYAFQVYFSSPRHLDMVSREFGSETAQHIREIVSHKIERHYLAFDQRRMVLRR